MNIKKNFKKVLIIQNREKNIKIIRHIINITFFKFY